MRVDHLIGWRFGARWRRAHLAATALLALLCLSACAGPRVLRGEVRSLKRVALVSLYARSEIPTIDTRLMAGAFSPDNGAGAEVIEMSIGDTEAQLEGLFGIEAIVPVAVAVEARHYETLPEALPPEQFTQVDRMVAVDIDDARTRNVLAQVATELDVDAVVVVRHEWWMARERYDWGISVYAYDRATILMVDRKGEELWRQTATARLPSGAVWNAFQPGINGAGQHQELVTMARETNRAVWQEWRQAFQEVRPAPYAGAPPPPPPPPILGAESLTEAAPPPASDGESIDGETADDAADAVDSAVVDAADAVDSAAVDAAGDVNQATPNSP